MMSHVHSINCSDLKKWLDSKEALLVDVREIDEYNEEHIPQSYLFPLSSFDINKIPKEGKKVVFHCRSGKRSMEAANRFSKQFDLDAYSLEGGILAWKKEGYPTNK